MSVVHPSFFEQLLGHTRRTGQHDRRLRADRGRALDAGARLQAQGLAGFLGADQHAGGAVDDARAVAGVVDVVDRSTCG
jgi:hypothetical protein